MKFQLYPVLIQVDTSSMAFLFSCNCCVMFSRYCLWFLYASSKNW